MRTGEVESSGAGSVTPMCDRDTPTQRLAKRPETADLAPLADAMGRTLGRRRSKKASPATAPKAPAPQAPAPQTPKQQ